MNPYYLNHTLNTYNHRAPTMQELSDMIRIDMNSNNIILVNPFNNQQINLSMLSHDVLTMNSRIDMLGNIPMAPILPPDPRVDEMQERIDQLEETIRKIEFMVGEN